MNRVNCPECGGSGLREGIYRDIACHDCGGEGSWEDETVCLCCEGPLTESGLCIPCNDAPLTEVVSDPLKQRAA